MLWVSAADSHMIKEGKLLTRGGALQRTWMDFARWTGQSLIEAQCSCSCGLKNLT